MQKSDNFVNRIFGVKMATIYYWAMEPLSLAVGHISMELDDGTYISHWPEARIAQEERNAKKNPLMKRGIAQPTLQDDKIVEGKTYTEKVILPRRLVDGGKVKAYWESLQKKGTNYHLLFSNCAQMVEAALRAGGFQFFIAGPTLTPFGLFDRIRDAKEMKDPATSERFRGRASHWIWEK